jgi:iron complex outermembrane receptor protein
MKASLIAPAVTLAAALAAPPALAQDAREPIIVTGALEEEPEIGGRIRLSVREIPATVDILTQEDFRVEGARTAIEAMNAAPGVAAGNLPGSIGSVSMRGFHRAVNYLWDGVRITNSDAMLRNWDSWSFERIEVIKGPASVTAGEGALAGAINFVPRRPELGRLGGETLASYGSFDSARLAGDLNVPLGSKAALRGDVAWSRSDGWVDDTGSSTLAGTLSLLAEPTERLSITLAADYFEDDFGTSYYGTPVVSPEVARDPSGAVGGSAGLVLDRAMRRVNFNVTDGDDGSESLWLRARVNWEITDGLSLVSDTGYLDADRRWRSADEYRFNAATGLIDRGLSLITHDHQVWNQRLHLGWDGAIAGHRNRLTIGGEVSETNFFTLRRFGASNGLDPFAPQRGTFPADDAADFDTRQDVTADVKVAALFAEDAFNLTPEWLLVAGLRWDRIEMNRQVANVTSGAVQTYGQEYNPVTWRLGTVYSLRSSTQLYAQYTRAVTPLSGLLFISATNAALRLTTGKSAEAGIKTNFFGDRAELTASVFHIRQDDILTRDPADPTEVLQGGSMLSTGGELSLTVRPTDELSIALSATLLDARYGDLIEAGGADRSGNRPQNVPEQLADLVVTYTPPSLPITLTGIVRHNGDFYTENANVVRVNSATILDAAIAWQAPFGTLSLRGRNLADAFYADWSGYASGLVFVGAPRSVELSLTSRF